MERKILIYSMLNNLIIAILKIGGGLFYGLGSLLADGMHTLSDFITDIVSFIGSKISKKKPTKYHPFGFGKVEYLTNLFVGIILLLLGSYIIISSFFKESIIPPLSLLYILFITLILKLIAIIIMNRVGKNINSNLLITSVLESKADLYSSMGVIVITLILQLANKYPILKYSDLIGSLLIGLIVLKTAFKVIIDNSLCLIGEAETNKDVIKQVEQEIKQFNQIEKYQIELIKYGSYYRLQLNLELDSKLSLKQVTNLVTKIKKELRYNKKLKIKYVTIYVTDEMNNL